MTTITIESLNTLPDEADVRAAVTRIAITAFLDGLGVGDFLDMSCDALIAFRERHGLEPAVMNMAWQWLQYREIARMDAESTAAFHALFGEAH
jgi:hypothetical protein